MKTSATIIADSLSPSGDRLTTFQLVMHRFVLAEFNTHSVIKRNSASSRAIPVERTLDRFTEDPADPLVLPAEQPGMQGGTELTRRAWKDANSLLWRIRRDTAREIARYLEAHPDKSTRLHKSVLNRPMEWGQWHVVCATATSWQNFFGLRTHEAAQPEIRLLAELMLEQYEQGSSKLLQPGEYHLPYIQEDERGRFDTDDLVKMSTARVARTSMLTNPTDGESARVNPDADLALYERLATAEPIMHASPMEQVATPDPDNVHYPVVETPDGWTTKLRLARYGPFPGWQTHRIALEARKGYQSYC